MVIALPTRSKPAKPRICLALPGIHYSPESPYVRSTLPMVPYLEKDFEVTVAYRKVLPNYSDLDHRHTTILGDKAFTPHEQRNKFTYYSPRHYPALWAYQKDIDRFAAKTAGQFDLLFEKEWPWLGLMSQAFQRHQIPTTLLIEAWYTRKPTPDSSRLKRLLAVGLNEKRIRSRKVWAQTAQHLVVETEEMKKVLQLADYVEPQKPVSPIPYGVDEKVFEIKDRQACRQQLGIESNKFVFTYVGSLNRFIQEPAPIIQALGRSDRKDVVLYIVGDGSKRQELEEIAREAQAPVVFTGRLPQSEAAAYIGAANLCIAPYNDQLYWGGKFTCASLKVPEYLSCGRLILTIPCDRMTHLTDKQRYGYLVKNETDAYLAFLDNLPSFEQLKQQEQQLQTDIDAGYLSSKLILLRWSDIANLYKNLFHEVLIKQESALVSV